MIVLQILVGFSGICNGALGAGDGPTGDGKNVRAHGPALDLQRMYKSCILYFHNINMH